MTIKDSIEQLESLVEAWKLDEADLNQTDINAIKCLLNNRQELIDYLKEEQERLVKETSATYEGIFGKKIFVNEDIYNEVSLILSKIEKR